VRYFCGPPFWKSQRNLDNNPNQETMFAPLGARNAATECLPQAKSTSKFSKYLLRLCALALAQNIASRPALVEAMVKQGEERKYKHVYFHHASKTWTTVRRGYATVGHVNQDTAARLAAQAWGVTRTSLKKMPVGGETVDIVPTQRYRHVTWHCVKKVWVVQGGTPSRYLGCSADQTVAVHIACRALQCKPEDLELQAGRRACSTSSDTCQRMAVLMRVYKGKKRTEPMVPADIAHLMGRAGSDKVCLMHSATGQGMMFPYIISKFPDHRDKIAGVSFSTAGKCTEASLYQALLRVSREISGKQLPPAQVRNVGRKCMHHGSFVMFASKGLKMLRLEKKNVKTSGRERLQFGKGSSYAVLPLSNVMMRKLSGLMSFGKALAASKPPRTLADWRVEVDRLTSVIRSPPFVPGCTGAYRRSWAIRCGLIYKMRQHGVASLKVEQGDSVRGFLGNFPDQKSQVLALAGGKFQQHRRMLDIFNDCGCSC
jgi:hypothetical protein